MLNNSLNYLCKRVRNVFLRSRNQACLLPELSYPVSTPTGLSEVPDWLEWLVRNQKYALIQCSFSYHKRCYRMIATRKRKRQAQLKARFLIPFARVENQSQKKECFHRYICPPGKAHPDHLAGEMKRYQESVCIISQ